jgi:hypothetical protein
MHRFANPARFHRFSQRVQPGLSLATLLSLGIGLWLALLQSPPDYQQGETVRIMYVQCPRPGSKWALDPGSHHENTSTRFRANSLSCAWR